MTFRLLALVGLLLAMFAAVSACDDGEEEPSPTDAPAATEPVSTATSTEPAATATPEPGVTEEPFDGTRGPIDVEKPPAPPVAVLTDVRTGGHGTYDRIVFEFEERLPGYRISYLSETATQCASGMEVPLSGSAVLEVRMYPGGAHDEQGNSSFAETAIAPALPAIVEGKQTCDFEAVLTWTLGLSSEVDFRVYELTDPFRLVVDVEH